MSDPGCFHIPLARYPGMNPFVLDWLDGKTNHFLQREPTGPIASIPRISPLTTAELSRRQTIADALIESNRRWGFSVRDEVERWARGETMTIIAGQQVGFAGGPFYTLAKIASVIRMKRDLEAAGRPATAFFWLATEDHDLEEVASLSLPAKEKQQQDLLYLRATRGSNSRAAVGLLPLPESLIQSFLSYSGVPRPSWLREGITFRDSFAELLGETIREGIVLIDSLLPDLRRAGAPLFTSLVEKWNDIQTEIALRTRRLTDAGYQPQIVTRGSDSKEEPYTLLFRLDHESRRQLFDGRPDQPETISTSALTRPLLQDFVLRPDVLVGGPAEVAYFAQIVGVHDLLQIPIPRVALRGHALVAPKRVVRLFSRFSIDPAEVFTNVNDILAAREPAGVAEVEQIATDSQRALDTAIARIRELALPADHALHRSINRSIEHINYHFRKLTERATRGLVRKDRERLAAVIELMATFYPDRHVQDRVVAWITYWSDFGGHLVDRLVEEIEPDTATFKIIPL